MELSESLSLWSFFEGIMASKSINPSPLLAPATHIVSEFLDASWESFGVCLQAAFGITLVREPAVIDADVLVTSLLPALLHHHICHLHVETLTAGGAK